MVNTKEQLRVGTHSKTVDRKESQPYAYTNIQRNGCEFIVISLCTKFVFEVSEKLIQV